MMKFTKWQMARGSFLNAGDFYNGTRLAWPSAANGGESISTCCCCCCLSCNIMSAARHATAAEPQPQAREPAASRTEPSESFSGAGVHLRNEGECVGFLARLDAARSVRADVLQQVVGIIRAN